MAIEYPTTLPIFPTQTDGGIGTGAFINDISGELLAALTEFGILPKGNHVDVKARLNALDLRSIINIIINGGFEVWQRNTSFSSPASGSYTADRWKLQIDAGPPTFTVSREASVIDEGLYAMKVDLTVVAGCTGLVHYQFIENFQQYRGKTVSFQMRVHANVASKFRLTLDDGISATAVSSYHSGASAYETLTVILAVSATATRLRIGMGQDSAPSVGTAYFDSGMFIVGLTPLAFVPSDPEIELARCQRYYEKSYAIGTNPASLTGVNSEQFRLTGAIPNGESWGYTVRWKVTKRTTPTIVLYSFATGATGVIRNNTTGVDKASVAGGPGDSCFNIGNNTGGVDGAANDHMIAHWTADAEI